MQLIFIKENYPENMGIFMLYVDVSCDQKNVRPRVVWSVIRYMYLNGANDIPKHSWSELYVLS
jgi:hypothetical protein